MAEPDSLAFACACTEDDSGGVFAYDIDETSGRLRHLSTTPVSGPSFLTVHPNGESLYTVQEADGVVTAFRIEGPDGELTELNQRPSQGADPCYVSVDPSGECAFVANYTGGTVAMFPIESDGRLGDVADVAHHGGSSVDLERQQGPHPHSVGPCPENRFIYVPDLGTDRVAIYEIDFDAGDLQAAETPYADLQDGAGPRHFEFHPNGQVVYVVNELNSTLTAFDYDADTGALTEVETVSALPDGYDEESYASDIHVHPSGEWAYVSNRGHDSIAIFALDGEQGELKLVDHESTGGQWPRDFAVGLNGQYLYVENRHSDSIVVFEIDAATGELTATNQQVEVPEPICWKFC